MVQAIPHTIVDLNQQSYQRLKSALALHLRRQIFIGICDDLHLRDRLVRRLEEELSGSGATAGRGRYQPYPYLVSLHLSLENPDPIAQISQWLTQNPPPEQQHRHAPMPAFQLIGVEHLSRHAASLQWLFLNHLRGIERSLPALESSLVLWVTRPWSRMIPQAAPNFWRCRTAVFDFIGEPTPFVSQPETFPIAVERSQRPSARSNIETAHRSEDTHAPTSAETDVAPEADTGAVSDAAVSITRNPLPEATIADSELDSHPKSESESKAPEPTIHHLQIPVDALLPQTAEDEEIAEDKENPHQDEVVTGASAGTNGAPDGAPDGTTDVNSSSSTLKADNSLVSDPLTETEDTTAPEDLVSDSENTVSKEPASEELTPEEHVLENPTTETLIHEEPTSEETVSEERIPEGPTPEKPTSEETVSEESAAEDSEQHAATNIEPASTTGSELAAAPDPEQQAPNSLAIETVAETETDDSLTLEAAEAIAPEENATAAGASSVAEEDSDVPAAPDDATAPDESAASWAQSTAPVMPLPPTETELYQIHQEGFETGTETEELISDSTDKQASKGASGSVNLPFLPGLGDTAPSQHDDELEVLEAEPKILRGSLPPSHGVQPKVRPPQSGSSAQPGGVWLDDEIAEVFQGNLQEDDPQAYEALQQIERLREQQAPISIIAGSYRGLGNLYRNRIEQGDISPQNLLRAMKAYEQVLQFVRDSSPIWSEVLNDMGNLCWLLSRCAPTPEHGLPHLQQGIRAYQMALSKINPHTHPQTYPMIQNNLGAAYGDMARHQNPVENLQQSLAAYQEALRYRKSDLEPMRYASTQNNLGTTYWNLAQYRDPKANLKQAIAAYTESLRYYQPDEDAINYAMIQNNLGTAYWNLSQHERSDRWLRLAIEAYTVALQYRTLEVNPVAYGATQNNLGTAYWHLSSYYDHQIDSRLDYLHQAVAAYNEALQAVELIQQSDRPAPVNFDVLATRNNLGLVLFQIATDRDRSAWSTTQPEPPLSPDDCLDQALDHHLAALHGWQGRPDLRQTAIRCIVQTLRAISDQKGLMGQNLVLSKIPAQLLPEILPQI